MSTITKGEVAKFIKMAETESTERLIAQRKSCWLMVRYHERRIRHAEKRISLRKKIIDAVNSELKKRRKG